MAVVKLILGSTTGQGGAFSNTIVNSGNTLSNASLKTNDQNEFIGIRTLNKNGREMLSWGNNGILRFNSSGKLSNNGIDAGKLVSEAKPDMLVFGAVPSSKEYSVKLIFKGTKNVKGIVVYGDKVANQFATEAILNGVKTIYSGEYKMEINFNSNSDEQIVEFIKWNRANYNASFSQISVLMNNYEVSRGNGLKNVESLSQSTAQNNQIHYGVIANSGNVEVLDPNGEIKKLVLDGTLPISNMPVQVICNGKQIQSHISVDSDYDNNAKTLNIEFTNDLANWQDLQYKGYAYPKKSENAYNMLLDVLSSIGYTQEEVDEMLSTEIVYGVDNEVGTIKHYLEQITIPYPYLPQASVRETIDKFCTLAQLQVFKTDNDKIKFISARPIATDKEKAEVVFVDKASIFGNFTRAILLKNKYDAVELFEKKVNDVVDYDTVIGNISDNEVSLGDNGVSEEFDKQFTKNSNSNVSWLIRTYSYVDIDAIYKTGSIIIPKKSNNNLNEIESFYTGLNNEQNPNIKHTLSYTNTIYNCSANYNGYNSTDVSNITLGSKISETNGSGVIDNISVNNVSSHTYGSLTVSTTASVNLSDKTNLSTLTYNINENGDYVIEYKVLVGRKSTKLKAFTRQPSGGGSIYEGSGDTMTGTQEHLLANSLDITFYGEKRTITFEDVSVSDEIFGTTFVSLQGNNLLQQNSKFNSSKISNIIKNNIKIDYSKGIANASMTVACVDYYSNNKRKIKDWSKGETFEVGDVVKVEGDDNLWRVTGRNFRKGGVPEVELQLQQIK